MSLPVSRRLDFSEIPVIEIGALVANGDAQTTVDAIGRACSEVGFFHVRDHGVPSALIERLQAETAQFFARPREEKMRVVIDSTLRGYLPLYYRSKKDDEHAGTNHQEGFWMGHDRPLNPDQPFDGPNHWPAGLTGLKQVMEAYFVAVETLAGHLQRAFSATLDVDPARFQRLFEHSQSRLKLNHYPPQVAPERLDEIGVLPHSDTGAFTILWQDDVGGLEIANKSGEWVRVPPIPETFVINLGNVMQMWSFGRFSSTPHRVINRSGGDRYSIPFFANPGHDAVIEPLVPTDGAPFDAFSFGPYQRAVLGEAYPVAFDH